MYNDEYVPMRYRIGNLLIELSAGAGVVYLLYLAYTFYSSYQESADAFYHIGIGLAYAIMMPHLICTIIAVILNIISIFVDNNAILLISAILYTVAMILLFGTFYYLLISTVLMYVAFCIFSKD